MSQGTVYDAALADWYKWGHDTATEQQQQPGDEKDMISAFMELTV